MNRSDRNIEDLARRSLNREEMSTTESEYTWSRIEGEESVRAELATADASGQPEPGGSRRRFQLVGAASATVALAATLAVALLPSGGGGDESRFDLPRLSVATAAEVLTVTAENTERGRSLMPGPGQVLYFRNREIRPYSESDSLVEEWTAPDGSGRRRISDDASGSENPAEPPTTMRFGPGGQANGSLDIGESWRASFSINDLAELPNTAAGMLESLREAADASVEREGGDYSRREHELFGRDLYVLVSATLLLSQAPLEADQRAALYELLVSAPDWHRKDGGARLTIENRGRDKTQTGAEGLLIRTTLGLSAVQADSVSVSPGEWVLELLIDPRAGDLLEIRELEDDANQPDVTRIEKLALIDEPR